MMEATKRDNLAERVQRWRSALAQSDTGPLVVAREIRELSQQWDSYKSEADGLSCSAYLSKLLGKGKRLSYFIVRAEAVDLLGESCRRTTHHEVAVWVKNNAPQQAIDKIKFMLRREQRANGGNPISISMAKPKLYEILGRRQRVRQSATCQRCAELEARIRELTTE